MALKVDSGSRLFRPWAARTDSSDQDSTVSTTTLLTSSDERVQFPTPVLSPDSHPLSLGCTKQPKGHSKSDHRLRKSVETIQDGSLIKPKSSELSLQEIETRNSVSLTSANISSNSFPPVIPGSSSAFAVHEATLAEHDMLRTFLPGGLHLSTDMVADVWSEALCCPDMLLLGHGLLQTPAAVEHYATFLQHQQAKQARKQRPKKYSCPHCRVAFSNNGQLKGHIRIHTGERPFKCDAASCGKTFTRNEELTRHKRIHSGLRPFACSTCGKRFGRKDHLKKHSRTHSAHARLSVPLPLSALCYNPYLYGY